MEVRRIDRSGKVQESGILIGKFFGGTFPDGAQGIQTIGVAAEKQ